jgi:hypothetical protein
MLRKIEHMMTNRNLEVIWNNNCQNYLLISILNKMALLLQKLLKVMVLQMVADWLLYLGGLSRRLRKDLRTFQFWNILFYVCLISLWRLDLLQNVLDGQSIYFALEFLIKGSQLLLFLEEIIMLLLIDLNLVVFLPRVVLNILEGFLKYFIFEKVPAFGLVFQEVFD